MKETTLGQVPVNCTFLFGNVVFERIAKERKEDDPDELLACLIAGTNSAVYISNLAWVTQLK